MSDGRGRIVVWPPRHDAFTTRAIERMYKAGIISADSRDRLLAGPAMEDSHQQVGFLQALLSVAIGHVEDLTTKDPQ